MSMTIHVDIVSAEGAIHSGTAEMVYAPAIMGEVGIAPRHTPFVTQLKPGEVHPEVVETKWGFHVIKLYERIEEKRKPFEEVRERIMKSVTARRAKEARRNALRALEEKAEVELLVEFAPAEKKKPAAP